MKLFVSDLDGTLLDRSGRLSRTTRDALCAQLARGLPLAVASARSIETIAPLFEGVPLTLPVIEFNGACLTDLRTRQCLHRHTLPPSLTESIVSCAEAVGLAAVLASHDGQRQQLHPPAGDTNAGVQWYLERRRQARDPRVVAPEETKRTAARGAVCVTVIGRPRPVEALQETLHESFGATVQTLSYDNRYQPGWQWLTVQAAGVTKGRALRDLAQHVGERLEATTAFGDEVNDLPLFEAAGVSVAVANAIEPLRAIADEVIGPHHEDSVSHYLRERWTAA